MRTTEGFSLIETIVAIAICGIILASLLSVTVSSLRHGRNGNFKIQATQVLDTVGRRIAGGNDLSLLPAAGAPVEIGYTELDTLLDLGPDARTDAYRVTVERDGTVSVGDSTTVRYRVEVCHRASGEDICVRGTTLGREGSGT